MVYDNFLLVFNIFAGQWVWSECTINIFVDMMMPEKLLKCWYLQETKLFFHTLKLDLSAYMTDAEPDFK